MTRETSRRRRERRASRGAPTRRDVRPHARRRRDDAGFTILEVALALIVLLVMLVAVSSLLVTSFTAGTNSRLDEEATTIANDQLDSAVQGGVATLLNEMGDQSVGTQTSAGVTFTIEREVTTYDPTDQACVSPASDPEAMLKVTFWATWSQVSGSAQWWVAGAPGSTSNVARASTLMSLPANDINPLDGALLVQVSGATSEGVSGVAITISGSTSEPTLTTGSTGCVVFLNLTPGTWSVTGSEPGYIDNKDDWNTSTNAPKALSSSAQVTAATTTTVPFTYEKAATVTPNYTLSQGTVPVGLNLPLSFYSSDLSPPTSPYVAAAPSLVYPFSGNPSYSVVAGSCGTLSAPDGGSTDGQPLSLTAGESATVNIPLVPVTVVVTHGGSAVQGAVVSAAVSSQSSCTMTMPTIDLGTTACSGTCTVSLVGPSDPGQATLVNYGLCNSSVTLTSNVDPSSQGSPVQFTATVANAGGGCNGRTPSGTVTFYDGSTALDGPSGATLSHSGAATYTTSALPVGNDQITAQYSGDSYFSGSTSSALTQTVNSTTTTTASTTTTTIPTTTTTTTITSSTPLVASGLPYGQFVISAVDSYGTSPSPVTVVVKPAGVYVGGSLVTSVTVAD